MEMKLRCDKKILFAIYGCLVSALAICLSMQFWSGSEAELRLPATNYLRVVEDSQRPANIENNGDGMRVWAMRRDADAAFLDRAFVEAFQFIADAPGIVAMESAKHVAGSFHRPMENSHTVEANSGTLAPLLHQDGASAPRLFASVAYGRDDALDLSGRPLRWVMPENLLAGYSLFRPAPQEKQEAEPALIEVAEDAPLPPPRSSGRESHYRELVENFAKRYNLSVELVMAIIHSESGFTPTLVSNKSAMGLMQLLPSTASDEVHRFLYGHRGQVSYEQLSVPEINIRYGTAYLHILFNRYFQDILNGDVRESCAIAAYNLGPNRFLRLYGATNGQAVEKINSMSAGEFYADLPRRLPARETRYFVNKVRRMKEHYSTALQPLSN